MGRKAFLLTFIIAAAMIAAAMYLHPELLDKAAKTDLANTKQKFHLEPVKISNTKSPNNMSSGIKNVTWPVKSIRKISPTLESYSARVVETGRYRCKVDQGTIQNISGADLFYFADYVVPRIGTPPIKGRGDLWGFFSHEPQNLLHSIEIQQKWDGLFNYSVTFTRDNKEGSLHVFRDKLMTISPPKTQYFTPTPRMRPLRALWMVSHCTEPNNLNNVRSAREEYAVELAKYIPIDIYTPPQKHNCDTTLKHFKSVHREGEPNMNDYMFYLSFENNNCQDYITEKLWKILESNSTTIPVALGGLSIEDYELVAPPNSFIHVRNFTSPEALANHLKFVSQDDNAFDYYHQWRNEFHLDTSHHIIHHDRSLMYHGDWEKYFCEMAHERPQRVWNTFSKDFNKHQCLDVSKPKMYCTYYNLTCGQRLH